MELKLAHTRDGWMPLDLLTVPDGIETASCGKHVVEAGVLLTVPDGIETPALK